MASPDPDVDRLAEVVMQLQVKISSAKNCRNLEGMQNCYKKTCKEPERFTEQDERLTAKHIKALSFLQDLGKENRELKIKVSELEAKIAKCPEIHHRAERSQIELRELQARMTSQTDAIVKKLLEKHRAELMETVEERQDAEKRWQLEKQKYETEIERCGQENSRLRACLADTQKKDVVLAALQMQFDKIQEELTTLKEENVQMEQVKKYQLQEIEHLNSVKERNDHLIEELQVANQKNKELQFRNARLERELNDAGYSEQEDRMNTLKNKLTLLHQERSTWTDKEKNYQAQIQALKDEISKLRKALADSERMRVDLHKQIDALVEELDALRQKSAFDRTGQAFKDFVQIKREVSNLREENDDLKGRLRTRSGLLPSLKPNGATACPSPRSGKSERRVREVSSMTLFGRR